MTNMHYYKNKIIDLLNKGYPLECVLCGIYKRGCNDETSCTKLIKEAIQWLDEEHTPPIRLTSMEYLLLEHYKQQEHAHKFEDVATLIALKESGHYKTVLNTKETLDNILNNSIVISENYDDFDETK